MKKLKSPFPVNGYFGPDYFCDRESELKLLEQYVAGKIPVVIFGVRRLGKSGLIKHLFHKSRKVGVFVDLQKSTSFQGLVNALADGIGAAFPQNKYAKVWDVIKSFRPTISFDPISNIPQFSFNVQREEEVQQTLHGLLELLASRKEEVIIAFDEFQEISKYPENNVEGILRAVMQRYANLNYVFSGSQTSLLAAMFQEGSRPFFANTAKLYLEKIDSENYEEFILYQFESNSKSIEQTLLKKILSWTEIHTYYTQFVCNQLFLQSGKQANIEIFEQVQWQILQSAKHDYFQIRELLSPGQKQLFYTIAKEIDFFQPTAKSHIKKYNLGTPRGVQKGLDALVDKQQVNRYYTDKGEPYYKLSNVFIMRYINTYL